jgi:hypothetical protein
MPYNKNGNKITHLQVVQNPSEKENKMAYTVDTKVGEILKDADSIVSILQKDIPLIAAIKEMSLKDLLEIPQVKQLGITEAMVNGVLAQINAKK